MKKITAAQLGGTLFVPATHKHLDAIARGDKFPQLRSVVFDTEDGIGSGELTAGLDAIAAMLCGMLQKGPLRFLRPRNVETLRMMLSMEGIEKIDGFVLPKFGLDNAEPYLETVGDFPFMPSIEGEELFDAFKLQRLRELLLPFREQVVLVRFGAEDMMRQLGMRRECEHSLYDLCAPSQVIANILMTFKPYGFDVSAPVYRCYKDLGSFETEVRRDLAEGLLSKTIIHPDQIEPIERLYRVTRADLDDAKALLDSTEAVFASGGAMAETSTQRPWAQSILTRAEFYGVD